MSWFRRLVAYHSPRRPGFDPRSVRMRFMVDKVVLDRFSSEDFSFPLSVSFHQHSIRIHISTLPLPEEQSLQSLGPSKKQCQVLRSTTRNGKTIWVWCQSISWLPAKYQTAVPEHQDPPFWHTTILPACVRWMLPPRRLRVLSSRPWLPLTLSPARHRPQLPASVQLCELSSASTAWKLTFPCTETCEFVMDKLVGFWLLHYTLFLKPFVHVYEHVQRIDLSPVTSVTKRTPAFIHESCCVQFLYFYNAERDCPFHFRPQNFFVY